MVFSQVAEGFFAYYVAQCGSDIQCTEHQTGNVPKATILLLRYGNRE